MNFLTIKHPWKKAFLLLGAWLTVPLFAVAQDEASSADSLSTQLQEIRRQIHLEELFLDAVQSQLQQVRTQESQTNARLSELSTEISAVQKAPAGTTFDYQQSLRSTLEATREKQDLLEQQAASLTEQLELRQDWWQDWQARYSPRKNSILSTDSSRLWQLFTATESLGEWLEDHYLRQRKEQQQSQILEQLHNALKFTKEGQAHWERLAQHQQMLLERASQEQQQKESFLQSKQELQAALVQELNTNRQTRVQLTTQQARSTQTLQALRQQQRTLREALGPLIVEASFQLPEAVADPLPENIPVLSSPLRQPLRITAGFQDPAYFQRFGVPHNGVDLAAKQGADLLAPADGEVLRAFNAGMGYSYIILKHTAQFYTVYGHLSRIDVKNGDWVQRGAVIGATGGSPNSVGAGRYTTGPHLHFEAFFRGKYLDGAELLGITPAEGVLHSNKDFAGG